MAADLPLIEHLAELGFDTPESYAQAREVLEREGLTRAGKINIAETKLPQVREVLEAVFHVSCSAQRCADQGLPHLTHITCAVRKGCWVCGGSSNRGALRIAEQALAEQGIRKIVIVGGSPNSHQQLRNSQPEMWELRLISGSARRTQEDALADIRWADLILIWGSTQLSHKVSELYTRESSCRSKLVLVAKRSVEALLTAATEHCSREPRPRQSTRSGPQRRRR